MFNSLLILRLLQRTSPVLKSSNCIRFSWMKNKSETPAEKPDLLFGRYLLITNTIYCGITSAIENFIVKKIVTAESPTHSEGSVVGQFLLGSLLGPWQHFFFKWIHKIMPVVTLKNSFLKILLDQIIGTPAGIFIMFVASCFRQKKTHTQIRDEFKASFFTTEYIDYVLSPIKQFVNFHFLNPKYNVVFINTVNTLQNIIFKYFKQ